MPIKRSEFESIFGAPVVSKQNLSAFRGKPKKSNIAQMIQAMKENETALKAQEADRKSIEAQRKQQEDLTKNRKLSVLERVIAAISAFETGNTAYNTTKRVKEGKFNPAKEVFAMMPGAELLPGMEDTLLGGYKRDVGENLKDAIVGRDKNQSLKNKKTYKDVLKEVGFKDKTGGKWYQNIDFTDIGGFVGDVALDPTTYISAGIAKGGAKVVGKNGAEAVLSRTGREAAERFTKDAAKRGVKYADAITAFIKKELPKNADYLGKSGIRFAGKTVVSPELLKKYGLSAIGERGLTMGTKDAILSAAEKIPKVGKYVTGTRDVVKSVFDPLTSRGLDKVAGGAEVQKLLQNLEHSIEGEKLFQTSQIKKLVKQAEAAGVDPTKLMALLEKKSRKQYQVRNVLREFTNDVIEHTGKGSYQSVVSEQSTVDILKETFGKMKGSRKPEVIAKINYAKSLAKDILKGQTDRIPFWTTLQKDLAKVNFELPDITPNTVKQKVLNTDAITKTLGRSATRQELDALALLANKGINKESLDEAARIIMKANNKVGKPTALLTGSAQVNDLLARLKVKRLSNYGVRKAPGEMGKIAREIQDRMKYYYREEFSRGMRYNEIDNYMTHIKTKEAKALKGVGVSKAEKIAIQKMKIAMKSNNQRVIRGTVESINKSFEKKYGVKLFEDNAFASFTERTMQHIEGTRVADASKWLVDNQGIAGELGEDGLYKARNIDGVDYIPVWGEKADGSKYLMREFEGVLFPRPVAEAIQDTFNTIWNPKKLTGFLDLFDNITNKWKTTVTGLFPAFTLRNIQGGMFNNWVAGVNHPKYYKMAEDILDGKDGTLVTDKGVKIAYNKIRAMLREADITNQTGIWDLNKELGDISKNIAKESKKKTGGRISKATRWTLQKVEDRLRTPLFVAELKKGNSFEGAMEAVNKYHFDYTRQAHTSIENDVLRRVIPFYVWTRHNIPLQIEQMGRQPGKYSATFKLMQGGDREEYNQMISDSPEYARNQPQFKIGNKLYNVELPFADVGRLGEPKQLVSMINPLIKTPIEQAINYNIFTGEKIRDPKQKESLVRTKDNLYGVPMDMVPAAVKKVFGIKKNNDGEWMQNATTKHLTQSLAFGRVQSTMDALYKEKTSTGDKVLKVIAGVTASDPKRFAASEFRKRALAVLPADRQKLYDTLHINYDGETPLLNSVRKGTIYIDAPELWLLDNVYYKQNAKNQGMPYDPVYDLSWEQAKQYYAQTAQGDGWNADALQKTNWYTKFMKARSKYFDAMDAYYPNSKYEGSESTKYYKKASPYIQAQMDAGNFKDKAVSDFMAESRQLKNDKRTDIGLITKDPKNTINSNVISGLTDYKASTGKSLPYMQALRMAGIDTYDSWFKKHPELDPKNGAVIKGAGSYSSRSKKVNLKYKKLGLKKVSKAKIKKLSSKAKLKSKTRYK